MFALQDVPLGVFERAGCNTHGDCPRTDALRIVGVHKVCETAVEARRGDEGHFAGDFDIFEHQFGFRHAAKPHGAFASGDRKAFRELACGRVGQNDEAADAFFPAVG